MDVIGMKWFRYISTHPDTHEYVWITIAQINRKALNDINVLLILVRILIISLDNKFVSK